MIEDIRLRSSTGAHLEIITCNAGNENPWNQVVYIENTIIFFVLIIINTNMAF